MRLLLYLKQYSNLCLMILHQQRQVHDGHLPFSNSLHKIAYHISTSNDYILTPMNHLFQFMMQERFTIIICRLCVFGASLFIIVNSSAQTHKIQPLNQDELFNFQDEFL